MKRKAAMTTETASKYSIECQRRKIKTENVCRKIKIKQKQEHK